MLRLDGMVALITGGAGPSIGQGITHALAECGASVIIADRSLHAARELADRLNRAGHKAEAVELDVSSQVAVDQVVHGAVEKHKRLDILVNSAGIGLIRPLAEVSDAEYRELMQVDLDGVFYSCRASIPYLQQTGGGVITNIASIHALATTPNYAVYAAAKGGVAAMTRGIAVQYGKANVRANVVCPGLVDGPQSRRLIASFSDDVQSWIDAFVERHQAVPSLIQPRDVGYLVAFLSSGLARSITGAVIPVDGGTMSMATSFD